MAAASDDAPAKKSGDTEDTKRLKRVAKLFEALEELEGRAQEIRMEIVKLLRGEPTVGDLLREAANHFSMKWEQRYRSEYVWRHTIDIPNLKRLLKMLGIDEVMARMSSFLVNNDAYFTKNRHGFGVFVATINQHTGAATERPQELELASAPGDCRHKPLCRSDIEHTQRLMEDTRGTLARR